MQHASPSPPHSLTQRLASQREPPGHVPHDSPHSFKPHSREPQTTVHTHRPSVHA